MYQNINQESGWRDLPEGGALPTAGSSINNKTGAWTSQKPVIDHNKCTGCRLCTTVCPENAIVPTKEGDTLEVLPDYCKGCNLCGEACPQKAITLKEKKDE